MFCGGHVDVFPAGDVALADRGRCGVRPAERPPDQRRLRACRSLVALALGRRTAFLGLLRRKNASRRACRSANGQAPSIRRYPLNLLDFTILSQPA